MAGEAAIVLRVGLGLELGADVIQGHCAVQLNLNIDFHRDVSRLATSSPALQQQHQQQHRPPAGEQWHAGTSG